MIKKIIDEVNITIEGVDDISDDEIKQYIEYTNQTYINNPKHQTLTDLKLYFDNDDVKIEYKASLTKFERIRRITGSR